MPQISNMRAFKTLLVNSRRNLSTGGKVVVVGGDSSFKTLSESSGKKVFYFTAAWCPPSPVFEKLSVEYPDIAFLKIDVDLNPDAATFNSIRSVPTFQFRSGPKKIEEFAGADEQLLRNKLTELVAFSD